MSDFNLQAKGLFGRYCRIEMFRYGVPNEFYIHKIVSQNRQNTYCDVPLRWDSEPETHPTKEGVQFPDNLEEVIWVVQCGIDETRVFPVALKDVELLGEDFNTDCEFHKTGSDGYPFCASATEIMRLRDENAKLRELMRKLYGGYMGGHYTISCNGCEHAYEYDGGYTPLDPDCCVFTFSDRYVGCWRQKRLEAEMRELGVEVD